jgi:hypothetical protein
VIRQNPVAGVSFELCARHTAPDRRQEIVVAAGMRVEQLGQERQHGLHRMGAAVLLDVVEQADDLAAPDVSDLPGTQGNTSRSRTSLRFSPVRLQLAREILFGHGLECVGVCSQRLSPSGSPPSACTTNDLWPLAATMRPKLPPNR